ncbi:MAG TPA: SRPBCC family protein [Vicinamibacteria bacterium]|nr:SRPBCC family protein [Vicinamibacteria bacterium]
MRLLQRRFTVRASPEKAWAHLARVSDWPSWARHIRRVDVTPLGALTSHSEGVIKLTNGVRSTFRMEELNPGINWKWVGPFLWLTVHYDHRFHGIGPERVELEFLVDGEGWGVGVFGRLFAVIYAYALNLDRAIPLLVAELQKP